MLSFFCRSLQMSHVWWHHFPIRTLTHSETDRNVQRNWFSICCHGASLGCQALIGNWCARSSSLWVCAILPSCVRRLIHQARPFTNHNTSVASALMAQQPKINCVSVWGEELWEWFMLHNIGMAFCINDKSNPSLPEYTALCQTG